MQATGRGEAAQRMLIDEYAGLLEKTDTYALRLHDGHWAKIRVTEFQKNVTPPGASSSIAINRVRFQYAFQLIPGYGRLKPGPEGGL